MDSSLGLNIFTVLFLSGTFLAALVAGLGGFAFGIVAAAVSAPCCCCSASTVCGGQR